VEPAVHRQEPVGIFGTSYGGYTAVMELLRHPDVFAAASSSSPPTDWRNYDTIYTERYMWIPQENKDGYDKGSAMSYVRRSSRPADALLRNGGQQRASVELDAADSGAAARGKSFDVQVGPDQGHSALNSHA
jgi:dipeptidyl-peptidase-4